MELAVTFSIVSWVSFVFALLSIPSVLIQRRGRPTAALSWILAMTTVPAFGLLGWWLFGRRHLRRKKRKRNLAHEQIQSNLNDLVSDGQEYPEVEERLKPILSILAHDRFGVFPASSCNKLKLLVDGEQFFPRLEAAIEAATDHIHVLFYTLKNDEYGKKFRDLLARKAESGVTVRVLFDSIGTWVERKYLQPIIDAGGFVHACSPARILRRLPTLNFRNHRKIVVIDGQVSFTGGMNIGDEYRYHWHDLGFALHGPAVDQFQEVFVEDWYYATDEALTDTSLFGQWKSYKRADLVDTECHADCAVFASGPHLKLRNLRDAVFLTITSARERVWIVTPYFIPDPATLIALQTAVYRGVDVRLIVPEKSDVAVVRWAARAFYERLLDAGVRIFEYSERVLHAKMLIIDDDLTLLGSANMDIRSFRLNFEVTSFIRSRKLHREVKELFESDQQKSREITLDEINRQSYLQQFVDSAAHLFSPLL